MAARTAARLLLTALTASLALGRAGAAPPDPAADYHSYANVADFVTTRVDLSLDVDVTERRLRGSAILELKRLEPRAVQLVLDSRGLTVFEVSELTTDFLGATEKPKPMWISRPYHVGRTDESLGAPLSIDLPASRQSKVTVKIEYETCLLYTSDAADE